MTVLPIDQSDTLRKAIQIANELGQGTAMIQNPIDVSQANTDAALAIANLQTLQTDPSVTPEDLETLQSLESTVSELNTQSNALQTHTDTLLFGDSSGSLISGGISANAAQAKSAINLDDTIRSLDGPIEETCDLLNSFFGSVLGTGQEVLNTISEVLEDVLEAIGLGLSAVLAGAAALIAALTDAAAQVISLIASELATFAEWLAKQLDFGLGSFFSSLFDDDCVNLLIQGVGTTALLSILSG